LPANTRTPTPGRRYRAWVYVVAPVPWPVDVVIDDLSLESENASAMKDSSGFHAGVTRVPITGR
jgi:hypothetical protein